METDTHDVAAARAWAEVSKIKVETSKLAWEHGEAVRKASLPWYKDVRAFQLLFAVLTFGPLLFFYFKEFVLPVAKAENITLSLRLEETQATLSKKIKDLEAKEAEVQTKLTALVKERDLLVSERNNFALANRALQNERKAISARYNELSSQYQALSTNQNLSLAERDKYAQRATSFERESVRLRGDYERVQESNAKLAEKNRALESSVADLMKRLEEKPQAYAASEDALEGLATDKGKFEEARPHFTLVPSYIASEPELQDIIRTSGISVKILVDAEGNVVDARLAEGTLGLRISSSTAAAIIDFVKEVKFSPATIDGKPTPVWTYYRFGGPQM